MERMMVGVKLGQGTRSKRIRGWTGLSEIVVKAVAKKWAFARKLRDLDDKTWEKKVLKWTPDGRRPAGRPRTRWDDELRKRITIDWMDADEMRWNEALSDYTVEINEYCHV
ncbi:unnamed protein product [Bursaphelenchus okinawaensis]|uniref:Uncharacterized protein n=1 Tax=Bursaphelenchus okinawaensis TaxID=465554 RepID=A0A811KD20_9BILA|nr:unnamed protein product [Bursaphelenchus okinawaensis]CAG9101365.1 unnamed protein product [Bursaphelenchus okinawaensis]